MAWIKKVKNEPGPKGPLSASDRKEFERLKVEYVQIERNSWMQKAVILKTIRENRYYRETHDSFAKFCKDVFDLTRQHADRLICGLRMVEIIDGDSLTDQEPNDTSRCQSPPKLTSKEVHVRELSKVPSDDLEKVAKRLKTKQKVTAKDIKQAAKEVRSESASKASDKVSGHVRSALTSAIEMKRLITAIRASCNTLAGMLEGPFGIHMPAGQPIDQIRRIAESIWSGIPHCDCPVCESKGKGCTSCRGHGWLTKSMFNALPSGMKKGVKTSGD